MLKKVLIFIISAQAILTTACASDPIKAQVPALKAETQHTAAFQTGLQLVGTYHYNKPRFNDDFSSKAFNNYLTHLDPSRVYFLQSDIASFEKYRNTIDDAIFNGGPEMAFEIFNVYQQRLHDRIDFALTLLRDSFDFNQQDSFRFDREDAPWCADFKELDKLWKEKVKYECLLLASGNKPYSSYSETVKKRYENLQKMSSKTKSEDVFQLFMNSLLEVADPHTNYFSPKGAEDFNQSMSLSLEGIGAQLRTDNEYTVVAALTKGGPAEKSKKLNPGDKIVGVSQHKDSDFVNVIDWRIDDVVVLIRGKKGTTVRLEIIPADEPSKRRVIEIVRDKIVLEDQSAKSSVKEISRKGKKVKVGVVSIPTFYINFKEAQEGNPDYKSTTRDVKKLIAGLKKDNIDGLVIDLRNNGGGSLQEAIELTGLFIKQGPVVQVKDATGRADVKNDKDPEEFYSGPLIVLVNRFSASASEIFSAAIQDYKRGVVIGEKTFGKGTVQEVVDLGQFIQVPDKKVGQVKLTIAKFYRINGSSTQHKGVTPDILFPGVYDGDKFGEDESPYALPWDQINSSEYSPVNDARINLPQLQTSHNERMEKSKLYKFLIEDIAYLKVQDSKKYITLNMSRYKKELETQEKLKKDRELELKIASGKEAKLSDDLILNDAGETVVDMVKEK